MKKVFLIYLLSISLIAFLTNCSSRQDVKENANENKSDGSSAGKPSSPGKNVRSFSPGASEGNGVLSVDTSSLPPGTIPSGAKLILRGSTNLPGFDNSGFQKQQDFQKEVNLSTPTKIDIPAGSYYAVILISGMRFQVSEIFSGDAITMGFFSEGIDPQQYEESDCQWIYHRLRCPGLVIEKNKNVDIKFTMGSDNILKMSLNAPSGKVEVPVK